jgi:hypothetical protein
VLDSASVKAEAAKATISVDEFMAQAAHRFPHVKFIQGMPQGCDQRQGRYLTIALLGEKAEGCVPNAFSTTASVAMEGWWESVSRFINEKTEEVYIRSYPRVDGEVEHVLDTFCGSAPRLVPTPKFTAWGRLSFHEKKEPISG